MSNTQAKPAPAQEDEWIVVYNEERRIAYLSHTLPHDEHSRVTDEDGRKVACAHPVAKRAVYPGVSLHPKSFIDKAVGSVGLPNKKCLRVLGPATKLGIGQLMDAISHSASRFDLRKLAELTPSEGVKEAVAERLAALDSNKDAA